MTIFLGCLAIYLLLGLIVAYVEIQEIVRCCKREWFSPTLLFTIVVIMWPLAVIFHDTVS